MRVKHVVQTKFEPPFAWHVVFIVMKGTNLWNCIQSDISDATVEIPSLMANNVIWRRY